MTTLGSILVAEDDASIMELLVQVLTEEGYMVQSAATGPEALAVLLGGRPDLALLDLRLPGLNGLSVADAARAQLSDVPVVIMTASNLSESEHVTVGMYGSLRKPFDLDDLLTCVAEHIRRR
jgi:DNA-binding response OmpR family regulator